MTLSNIYIIAGKGGHETQAKKLSDVLRALSLETELIFETSKLLPNVSDLSKERPSYSPFIFLPLVFSVFINIHHILFRGYVKSSSTCIFFGPLNNVPMMLICKLRGCRCIFVESWSRFDENSKTYQLARLFKFELYVQNPGIFCEGENVYIGRLG